MYQASTKYTPFKLLYGRDPYMPFDRMMEDHNHNIQNLEWAEKEYTKRVKTQFDILQSIRKNAAESIKIAQNNQKKAIDRKILGDKKHLKQPPFEIGDTVLVYNSAIDTSWSGKLMDTWLGPYIVHKANTKHGYILKTMKGTIMPKVVHGNRMKIYKVPDVLFRPTLTAKSIMNNNNYTSDYLTAWINSDDNNQTNQDIQQLMLLLNDHENINTGNNVDTPIINQEDQQELLASIITPETVHQMGAILHPSFPLTTETEQPNGINEMVQVTQTNEVNLALPAEVINELQLLAIYEEIHTNIKRYRRETAETLVNIIKQNTVLQDMCSHNNRKKGLETILRANKIDPNMILSRTPFERTFTKAWRRTP